MNLCLTFWVQQTPTFDILQKLISAIMFKNVFQGGESVEVLTQQGSQPLVNWSISATGKTALVDRVYCRTTKGFCYQLNSSAKFECPKRKPGGFFD